jgi:putative Mg2+ transporter-C (MgtC) family protein
MADWLSEIGQTIGDEFSDLSTARHATQVIVRLVLAGTLGGILGYEREKHGKAAGMRTHMLVAIGAALFLLVPQQAGMATADLSRVLQGLVVGVGFLGAGTILKTQDEAHVHGLTTAAGVWMTAAVGMTVGLGREVTAILSTGLALAILAFLPHVQPNGTKPGSSPKT